MRTVVVRERLHAEIALLRRRLEVLGPEREMARARAGSRAGAEAWLAFLFLLVIVAGAGVWLGVAVRAVHSPAAVCTDL
jgi:hypothetical protein